MMQLPDRKHPAKGVWISENNPTIVFVTVCVKGRVAWLANEWFHDAICCIWKTADAWLVGRYMIMPDHIHFCVTPNLETTTIENWTRYWKSQFTKEYKRSHSNLDLPARWQENSWHHRLRSDESFEEKWNYIRMNPVREKLVVRPEDWPFQGEINPVRWE